MFGRKAHGDIKKSAIKVLDIKRDSSQRLKHLKNLIGTIKDLHVIINKKLNK